MFRTTLYDRISLICLIMSGILLCLGLYFALNEAWLKMIAFAVSGLFLWHASSTFAKYAIAASGRQN